MYFGEFSDLILSIRIAFLPVRLTSVYIFYELDLCATTSRERERREREREEERESKRERETCVLCFTSR